MSDDFIFHQKDNNQTVQPPKFYTIKGNEDFIDYENNPRQSGENINTQAKSLGRQDGTVKHFIKITGDGKPYNPVNEYANVKSSLLLKTIGKDKSEFQEVNPKIFNMYLNFLRTKNLSWLHNVEREMI